jgi:hypothetical protein
MLLTGSSQIDAERAFDHVVRARRRAALIRRLRRACAACGRLAIYERPPRAAARVTAGRRILEIPLDTIHATVEPSRAAQFDHDFRPFPIARARWKKIWLAEHRGAVLPPISVVAFCEGYAVRDGHHRVSVARARGALTIDAIIDGV